MNSPRGLTNEIALTFDDGLNGDGASGDGLFGKSVTTDGKPVTGSTAPITVIGTPAIRAESWFGG